MQLAADRPAPDEDRVRLASLAGTVAGIALIVAFFLPWVRVEHDVAVSFEERIEERLADPARPTPARAGDWRRLGRLVLEQGYVSGLDIFYWARTAKPTADALNEGAAPGDAGPIGARAIHVVAIVVLGIPLVALLLVLYFGTHRFRRARSPALILATLAGAAAVVTAGLYGIVEGAIERETNPGVGLSVLLAAGAALFLVGPFGIRLRNWWRVIGGAIAAGGALAILAWSYVRWGATL
ncbi:MAG: hypothetical protein ACYTG6_14560 [Planctomycetota bacterium]